MSKGKSQFFTWYCVETGAANYHTYGNKRSGTLPTEIMKYCPALRKRTVHKRRDTKSGY